MTYIQSPRGYIQYLCSDCHCLFDWPLNWQWGDEHYCEPCFDRLIEHPGYPVQDSFSDLDSPRLFSPLMKVLDPECYGIMRMEVSRWRALVKIEWERDRVALRLAVLQDQADELTWLVTSETVEYTQLANQLIELDKDHAGLVAEDAIEPGYNFKALEG